MPMSLLVQRTRLALSKFLRRCHQQWHDRRVWHLRSSLLPLCNEPLRPATVHPMCIEAMTAKEGDGLIGEKAEVAAAVGDDGAVSWKFVQPGGQFIRGHTNRAGNVTCLEFDAWPDIEEDEALGSQFRCDIAGSKRVSFGTWHRERAADLADFGKAAFGHLAQVQPEAKDIWTGETVDDPVPVAIGFDEVCGAEHLEVLGDVRDGHLGFFCEGLDVTWGLGEEIEEFEAAVTGQRLGDPGELWVDAFLEGAVAHVGTVPDRAPVGKTSSYLLTVRNDQRILLSVTAATLPKPAPLPAPRLGLRPNWRQFALLVAVNAFVGGMVGLERSVLPVLAKEEFGIASKTLAVSFIATFGLSKAIANLWAGRLSERFSRRKVLIAGWLIGFPVPLVIIFAPAWGWIVAANALLGLNQGLAWSMTVNMKIDLAGPKRRGLALGLNEAAGYLAVAAAAFLAGVIADAHGVRPEPFYLGIVFASLGLALSVLLVRDTEPFLRIEAAGRAAASGAPASLKRSFAEATWRRPYLAGASQAGFVNNLNDGLAWGIFPLFFLSRGLELDRVAILAALYPLVWGGAQLATGWASDLAGRVPMIVAGMAAQGVAISLVGIGDTYLMWFVAVMVLGLGTAMVYPTLLAAIGDAVHPFERATTLGVYRFWRDAGAMAGALGGGVLADLFGFSVAIQVVAALTVFSGLFAGFAMRPHSHVEGHS